jgi:hypothetical protein
MWWEKTVEYRFVLEADRERGLSFAAPLSGVEERASGDGIFSADSKLILVEFKRSARELDSDICKFSDYEGAEDALAAIDGHHFLVYGAIGKSEGSNQLDLRACTYFSRVDAGEAISILDEGVDPESFNAYLAKLVSYKAADGRSEGSVSPESVSCVTGVSSKGASSISLAEYVRIELPHLYRAPSVTSKPSPGPTLG